jgi:FlaA1/EpsC-like NDP-sugar epimerase
VFIQILIGTIVIFLSIVIQVVFISLAIQILTKYGAWMVKPPFVLKTTIALVAVVLWLIIGISLSAWSWAGIFIVVGLFQALEPALYFSIVTFTTLGYGDITLSSEWRILASFAAVNGLIIFGLNTAFLVEFTNRLRQRQEEEN